MGNNWQEHKWLTLVINLKHAKIETPQCDICPFINVSAYLFTMRDVRNMYLPNYEYTIKWMQFSRYFFNGAFHSVYIGGFSLFVLHYTHHVMDVRN